MRNAQQLAQGDSDHSSLTPCLSEAPHRQPRVPRPVPEERRDLLWLHLPHLVRRKKTRPDLNHHLFRRLARAHLVRSDEVTVSNHELLSVLAEITERGIEVVVMIDAGILELLHPTPRSRRREVIRIGRNRKIYFKPDMISWQVGRRGDRQVQEKRRRRRKRGRIEKLEKKKRRLPKKKTMLEERERGMKL